MGVDFDSGYVAAGYRRLVSGFPDVSVYPVAGFRVEWGPVFHRGRLDGSARVLVIGQDGDARGDLPACSCWGGWPAGAGFARQARITRSYPFVNAFLYSVWSQAGGEAHVDDPAIVAYRNRSL